MTRDRDRVGDAFEPPVPVCDLGAQTRALRTELDAAVARVLDRSWFVLGEEVARFEAEFGEHLGAPTVVGVASGTDAIHLAVRALGIGAGDRVLTAPNSAAPTACGIAQAGAIPSFADVDPESGLLDPASVEAHLDDTVRAIVVVHLFGRCADMDPILEIARSRSLPVIEDAAQAHGAVYRGGRAGTLGDLAAFSFYPSKNLGALGDAGAVVSRRPELRETLMRLRNYGQIDRYHHESLGFNSRLDELQAALLRVKLPHLERWNARRRSLAARYRDGLRDAPLILPPASSERGAEPAGSHGDAAATADAPGVSRSAEHLFVVRVADRDRFRRELDRAGVGTQIHYPIPIHLQRAFAYLDIPRGAFPVAESRAAQIVSLPLFPELEDATVDRIIEVVRAALRGQPHPEDISC